MVNEKSIADHRCVIDSFAQNSILQFPSYASSHLLKTDGQSHNTHPSYRITGPWMRQSDSSVDPLVRNALILPNVLHCKTLILKALLSLSLSLPLSLSFHARAEYASRARLDIVARSSRSSSNERTEKHKTESEEKCGGESVCLQGLCAVARKVFVVPVVGTIAFVGVDLVDRPHVIDQEILAVFLPKLSRHPVFVLLVHVGHLFRGRRTPL